MPTDLDVDTLREGFELRDDIEHDRVVAIRDPHTKTLFDHQGNAIPPNERDVVEAIVLSPPRPRSASD